ncbi:MAG TPA: HAD family phosphatase [Tepidanaerobacteraceae bacterium]|jgi:HAD superfamily hydrolase (TIGR01509 family)|nr:HAD family phosphatase [Tepidanaerobacteraceae bacterium]
MNFKGAIFDLDGTLLDSMPFWETLGSEYLKAKGIIPRENVDRTLKTMSLQQGARYLKREFSIPGSEDEIIDEIVAMIEDIYLSKVPLKAGALPLLERLYEEKVRMCIATATENSLAKAALERLGALRYFDFILTCFDTGMGKDRPEFFLKALELLNTPKEETIVFEDALYAIKSAKAAGLLVVAVYDESFHEEREEIRVISDFYLDSLEDWEMIL